MIGAISLLNVSSLDGRESFSSVEPVCARPASIITQKASAIARIEWEMACLTVMVITNLE